MHPNQYRCEECGEVFENPVEWESHKREVHSHYTCENCLEVFEDEEELESHHQQKHSERQGKSH